ncbi:hypothetical protein NMY22_g11417 [Coprinellus aureogranulatus]|nr:hypothetical protein NMY22_g11417 [Coprinellus aureogranulatus]
MHSIREFMMPPFRDVHISVHVPDFCPRCENVPQVTRFYEGCTIFDFFPIIRAITEGHTGLLSADDYFNILIGEQWAFKPGALEMERYTPGTVHVMPRGVVKQYKMHTGCFALEYARGWIPGMMPFGFADAFTSTLDFPTLFNTVRITGREIIHNLLLGKL